MLFAFIAYQSDGRCLFLSRALLSFSDFCLSWIHGIWRASLGFRRFSGFHSKQALRNSIRSGSSDSFIFRASASDLVLG